MNLQSLSPTPPCAACGGPTLIGEIGRLMLWSDNYTGESRAFWVHESCAVAGRFGE